MERSMAKDPDIFMFVQQKFHPIVDFVCEREMPGKSGRVVT
jgi:hypothetical protein